MLKPLSEDEWNYETAAHLLNRAGFGGSPSEIQKLAGLKHDQAVALLLDYEAIPDNTANPDWARPDPVRMARLREVNQHGTPEEKKAAQQAENKQQALWMLELRGWWLQRMARGPRPLQEKWCCSGMVILRPARTRCARRIICGGRTNCSAGWPPATGSNCSMTPAKTRPC